MELIFREQKGPTSNILNFNYIHVVCFNNVLCFFSLISLRNSSKTSVDTIINLSLLIQSHLYSVLILFLARVSLLLSKLDVSEIQNKLTIANFCPIRKMLWLHYMLLYVTYSSFFSFLLFILANVTVYLAYS
jgi:hypothetical protein